MTSSEPSRIELVDFELAAITTWRDHRGRHHDWPVVYLIDNKRQIYVGETTRARLRLRQHLSHPEKSELRRIQIIINEEFNKSACLDLESRLIAWLHADQQFEPLNHNHGQQNSDYFERHTRYQRIFDEVFDQLRNEGLFTRSVPQIENLNLFKLSPFKALNDEQSAAIEGILEGLFEDLRSGTQSTSVIQGGPGTGKTIVAIFLLKLLRDIQNASQDPDPDEEGRFSEFFLSDFRSLVQGQRVGFVVPQQSLRHTISKVFKNTPGLSDVQVLSPYTVGASNDDWDILVVDETHRLTRRGAGSTQGMFKERNRKLFGEDTENRTAVDWIKAKSAHQIFLVDDAQSVRPADVSYRVIRQLVKDAATELRLYPLESQMRLSAGEDYLSFARSLLTDNPLPPGVHESYDLRFFDDLSVMRQAVLAKEHEVGLSRLTAGYAWQWCSKGKAGDDAPFDIELDGVQLRWNREATDWIASPGSEIEVGSVHTVQGYDLNYAGVIVGPDIVWDEESKSIRPVRERHFDREVRRTMDDVELLKYIRNAYYVLLTRGMLGTYVYICDPALRRHITSSLGLV